MNAPGIPGRGLILIQKSHGTNEIGVLRASKA